jgi:hypothetical protein
MPTISQSVFARRKSARWDPTIPVTPVINAQVFAISFVPLPQMVIYSNLKTNKVTSVFCI